ncbi:MAG: hypothetical protein Kapaf2KO_07710 [Candidatus Kapaibacteriales bacterium]
MSENLPSKPHREDGHKPEWRVVIEHLVFMDTAILYRITRKMIIHLERMKVDEIFYLIEELNPQIESAGDVQDVGLNWPKTKGQPFIPSQIHKKVFDIADKYIPDGEISNLLIQWLNREKLRNLSKTIEKRHAPLIEVVEALQRYFDLGGTKEFTSEDERIGVRVSLIYRFLSENLKYISIAKHYITLASIKSIFRRIIGPAYGNGKVGGKSAGIILAESILSEKKKKNELLEKVYMPKSWFLTSDSILEFINYNALDEFTFVKYADVKELKVEFQFIEYIFKHSQFTPESISAFNLILDDMSGHPLVVRSSSLLEDSFEASFTGKYKSLFISNTGTREERLSALMNAITEVYASTFSPDAIEYRKKKNLIDFREEMGILIQEVVGHRIGKYFLPSYAGVALSNNEFRWSQRLEREDGVVRIVVGLGTRAVDRTMTDYPILISPGKPEIKIHHTVNDIQRYTQQMVDVLNLENNSFETIDFEVLLDESGGNIPGIEKMVSFIRDNTIVEPVSMMSDFVNEKSVITFNGLVKNSNFIPQIREMLSQLKKEYRSSVDIEFASDGEKLYILQCRPQMSLKQIENVEIPSNITIGRRIFSADEYVSSAIIRNIKYVIYVDDEGYSSLPMDSDMREIGSIVGRLNQLLPKREFIMVGPGRWGSKGDIKLGVPVTYADLNNTVMLIEYARKRGGYMPELSFGSHFFQDLVEADIRYLPLYPDNTNNTFNEKFFKNTTNSIDQFLDVEKRYLDTVKLINIEHYEQNGSLSIFMDGDKNEALAFIEPKGK